jgi:hypothetical protein
MTIPVWLLIISLTLACLPWLVIATVIYIIIRTKEEWI